MIELSGRRRIFGPCQIKLEDMGCDIVPVFDVDGSKHKGHTTRVEINGKTEGYFQVKMKRSRPWRWSNVQKKRMVNFLNEIGVIPKTIAGHW